MYQRAEVRNLTCESDSSDLADLDYLRVREHLSWVAPEGGLAGEQCANSTSI